MQEECLAMQNLQGSGTPPLNVDIICNFKPTFINCNRPGVTAVKTVVVDTGEAVGSAAVSGVTAVGTISKLLLLTHGEAVRSAADSGLTATGKLASCCCDHWNSCLFCSCQRCNSRR